jgi:small conductance mechanosensitive channel
LAAVTADVGRAGTFRGVIGWSALYGVVPSLVGATDDSATEDVSRSARGMWETFVEALPRVGVAFAMVAAGWVLSRVVRLALRAWWRRNQTPSFATVMSKVVGWLVLTVVTLLAIAVTFPSVRPVDILAGLGFFSVAIGFAFQDILENTLSGVLLLFRQPFRTGDQIEVEQRSGTVEAITIRETRLTTFDGQLLIIPNRDVYKNAIRVQTAYQFRRLEFLIGIAFESDTDVACRQIADASRAVPAVRSDPSPQAFVSRLGASVVEITVWVWTDPRQAQAIAAQHEVMSAIKRRLETAGIEMPGDIVALQATSSLAAALQGHPVTPGGAVA